MKMTLKVAVKPLIQAKIFLVAYPNIVHIFKNVIEFSQLLFLTRRRIASTSYFPFFLSQDMMLTKMDKNTVLVTFKIRISC